MILEQKPNAEVRARMKRARLSQADVAKDLGVSVQTFSKWINAPMEHDKFVKVNKVIDSYINSSELQMKVMYDDGAFPLSHAHDDDAGYDLHTPVDAILPARGSLIIDTGVHVAIPRGYVGMIKSKSGLNVRHGIRGEGVIDSGYTGSIVVKLYNDGFQDYAFRRGDKIIQLVIEKIATPELIVVSTLEDTQRGDSGFGSSGK